MSSPHSLIKFPAFVLKPLIGRWLRASVLASGLGILTACLPASALAVTPLFINVQDYGALGNGINDDTGAIQNAINAAATSGKPSVVHFPYTPSAYVINSTITIGAHNISIDGQNSVLAYSGTAAAIDAALVGGVTYPVNIKISNLLINVQTAGASAAQPAMGVRFRFSHSIMENVSVALLASNQSGLVFPGDSNGSGPYYNLVSKCIVDGHRGLAGWSVANQKGIVFTHNASTPYNSPNANTFIGGRVGAVDVAWHIEGHGNSIISPTCESIVDTVYDINNPDDTTNCSDNSIEGGYVEGFPTAKVYVIGSSVARTFIRPGLITSVSSTIISDNGIDSCILAPGFKQSVPLYPNPQVGLGLYKTENVQIFVYYGNPNGHVAGGPGSLCLNLNGGAGTLYVKQSGTSSTGWVAK